MAGRFVANPNLQREVRVRIVDPDVSRKADAVVAVAKLTAPVDTGHYKDSIHKEATPSGFDVVADADYSVYLEFGTRNMRAYRTLGRALDAAKDN